MLSQPLDLAKQLDSFDSRSTTTGQLNLPGFDQQQFNAAAFEHMGPHAHLSTRAQMGLVAAMHLHGRHGSVFEHMDVKGLDSLQKRDSGKTLSSMMSGSIESPRGSATEPVKAADMLEDQSDQQQQQGRVAVVLRR